MTLPPLPPGAYRALPAPADPRQAELGLSRWREAAEAAADPALTAAMRDVLADETGHRLLSAIFGNSPFLMQCSVADPAILLQLVSVGPVNTFAEIMRGLNRDLDSAAERQTLMTRLRMARRQVALVVAVADVAQWWRLERITGALSAFAEVSLDASLRHLLLAAAKAGEIELPHPDMPERDCGFFALGLGKLGARELNYSSDIDLILFYDADKVRYRGRHSSSQFYSRLAQELVRILSDPTGDGYVFRVDLRLRPDPGSTPAALSTLAALTYYESAGQNWERAALIKARPVAGDRAAGRAFLAELTPYLWRRHLDFAAIQDIHSIKRQINAHRGGGRIAVAGHNVKLGRGGIREIEFFAQTQQLIWGGRMPELRVSGTVAALAALAQAGRITPEAARDLTEAYGFLRKIEHRLQMIDDAQTHTLPKDPEALRRVAIFAGFDGTDAFSAELLRQLGIVERHYAHLFEEAPSLSPQGNLVFTGHEDDPDTLATLRGMGFTAAPAAAEMVRAWHHGRYRAMRSQRARELLTELVPVLLAAFGKAPAPDAALRRFDRFLAELPAGVQLLSLFYRNPRLIALLAEIMGASPRMADQLTRYPHLVEALLEEEEAPPAADSAVLLADIDRALAEARDEEELYDRARHWVGDYKFRIGVALLRERISGEEAGRAFAATAEAAIAGLLPRVAANFARAHGIVPGGEIAVLGLGKFGGREMSATSDLDLITVYEAPDGVEASSGPQALPVPSYYARLSQRLITALTAMTRAGNLYEVDMRLRPSGNAGPLASSLAAFRRYHAEAAWTWEHMALTRARVVAGPRDLRERIEQTIRATLTAARDAEKLRADVAEMRARMAESHRHPSFWNVKHRRGGLVDIEFVAQYLQLRAAHDRPELLHRNTMAALDASATAGILDRDAAGALMTALRLWHNVQQMLKLTTFDQEIDEADAAPSFLALMARSAGAIDFAALKRDMDEHATRAFALYRTIVERGH
ncbi:MAG TPA: bifunctional [glutamine synthetase] adenylyltransferase/[glutamine synthetase]-adenylyl-L-tyrosine phosphorylase [Stellaceae bacterium]|nr:bifunctional [glutamine synthetase] adenylyltransferase/[glutamine synthetase]-adenylyl-L-tyrosine phosphorylase [Stellaceae bacterium]